MKVLNVVALLTLVSFLVVGRCLAGDPLFNDLNSPSQEVRDAAAEKLRTDYTPPVRHNWEWILQYVKPGDPKRKLLDMLAPLGSKVEMGIGSDGVENESYRLDGLWMVRCSYSEVDNKIIAIGLDKQLQYYWVPTPPKFTGVWTTYYANGQKSHEIHYKDGSYYGEFTSFNPDGSKCVVQHYDETGCNGPDTGYFPSGKVEYRGQYKAGKLVGTWTWYNEDGSVSHTEERDN